MGRKKLSASEAQYQSATQALSTTEKEWKLAISDLQNKIEDKQIKEKNRNETKTKLTQTGKDLPLKKESLDKWNKKGEGQTAQLASLTQAYDHACKEQEQNREDSNFSNAVSKAEDALKAVKSSLTESRAHANKSMEELKALSQLAAKLKVDAASSEQSLASSITSFNTAAEKKKQIDLLRNDKTNAVKELRIKVSERKSQLALSQKNFEKAQIELKDPEEKFAYCDKILKRTQREYTRWLAEAVNIERHVALRNLRNLQEEEKEIKGILHQATELKKSALQSFEVATQSLRELPGKISGCEQILAEQKSVLREAEKGRERVIQAIEEKKSYISEVNQLASLAKGKSESEKTDSTLGEASEKFQETLTLLRKDLAETENQLAGKEQVLQDAKQAVSKAEHNLREVLTLQKSTPLLVKKNEDSLAEAQKKEVGTEINYNQFKTRFAQQSVKSEALLKKYLDLLPR